MIYRNSLLSLKMLHFILTFFLLSGIHAQSVLENEEIATQGLSNTNEPLITETVQRISQSRRIFILSNKNGQLNPGDFISILLDSKLAARALVAKRTADAAGIKIFKIYSLKRWNQIQARTSVQILRGDDSGYLKDKSSTANSETGDISIKDEDDLYNDTTILDDKSLVLDEKGKRHIKTDNVVAMGMGQISALNTDGGAERYLHFMGVWGYQLADNIWGEATLGQSLIKGFPSEDIDTSLTNVTLKVKYTFAAPLYSYIMPYIGYQNISAKSPDAGTPVQNQAASDPSLLRELELLEKVQGSSIIFGATILKRLVPGWFLRADLGTDLLSVGLALEF